MAKNPNRKFIPKFVEKVEFLKPIIPETIIFIFFIIWGWIISKKYYAQYPVHFESISKILSLREFQPKPFTAIFGIWFKNLISLVIAVLFFISAFGIGEKIRKVLKIETNVISENTIFSIGFGFACLIYGTFFIGILGGLYSSFFWIIFIILSIIGLIEAKQSFERNKILKAQAGLKKQKNTNIEFLLICILFLAGLVTFITALTPETFYDSLQYHLGVPSLWIQNHKIFDIPTIQQSYYQMNVQLLYLFSLLLKDESIAKLVNWLFVFLSVCTIFVFSKKYFSRRTGIIAGAIYLTTPVLLFLAGRTSVEPAITFFETMALFTVFYWLETKNDKLFYTSAIFTGLAISSKHTSVFSIISLITAICVYFIFYRKHEMAQLLRKGLIFLLINFAFIAPWLIKNLYFTGNPIYPFEIDFKNGISQNIKDKKGSYIDQAPTSLSPKNIFKVPWDVTIGNKYQESYLGAAFLFLLPFLFLFKKLNRLLKFGIFYIIPYYLLWISIGRVYVRFFIPFIAFFSIILAYYLSESKISPFFRNVLTIILILFLSSNLFFIASSQKMCQNPLGYIFGLQTKLDYLSIQRPTYTHPYYHIIDFANKNLPDDAKILFMGETRPSYSRRKVITHSAGDYNQMILWCKEVDNADELREKLLNEKVTHILFNVPEAIRLKDYDIFQFELKDLKVFSDFWNKYIKQIYSVVSDVNFTDGRIGSQIPEFWNNYSKNPFNYAYLYEIMSYEEANKPHNVPYNFLLSNKLYSKNRQSILKVTLEGLSNEIIQ